MEEVQTGPDDCLSILLVPPVAPRGSPGVNVAIEAVAVDLHAALLLA
jgi:hypothetical protein